MWTLVALAVAVILLAPLAMVVVPFLTWQRLPERAELTGDTSIKTLVFSHSAPLTRGVEPLVEFASRF